MSYDFSVGVTQEGISAPARRFGEAAPLRDRLAAVGLATRPSRLVHPPSRRKSRTAAGIRRGVYRWEESAGGVQRSGLPEPPARPEARVFQSLTVSAVRTVVSRHAADAGIDASRRNDLVLAASEVAGNSVRHAGGWGLLRIWRDAEVLVCEVTDHGSSLGALAVPRSPEPDRVDGYGLWLANQLADRVVVSSEDGGTVVRLEMRL